MHPKKFKAIIANIENTRECTAREFSQPQGIGANTYRNDIILLQIDWFQIIVLI